MFVTSYLRRKRRKFEVKTKIIYIFIVFIMIKL